MDQRTTSQNPTSNADPAGQPAPKPYAGPVLTARARNQWVAYLTEEQEAELRERVNADRVQDRRRRRGIRWH